MATRSCLLFILLAVFFVSSHADEEWPLRQCSSKEHCQTLVLECLQSFSATVSGSPSTSCELFQRCPPGYEYFSYESSVDLESICVKVNFDSTDAFNIALPSAMDAFQNVAECLAANQAAYTIGTNIASRISPLYIDTRRSLLLTQVSSNL